jgi:hypothetical protein
MTHDRLLIGALLLALAGCAGRSAPPSADVAQRPFPDIGGRTVMLLPVQGAIPLISPPASADPSRNAVQLPHDARVALEAELAYWLPQRAPRTRWIDTEAVERAVRQSPMIEVRVRELTVRDLQRMRLQSIGDPLYTELRRVATLLNARGALLPIGAIWIPEQGGGGRVHVALALIDTFGGDVLWQGVVAGDGAELNDATAIASVAEALARMIPQ